MRPSDITDGIRPSIPSPGVQALAGFNEAVGYYRRNRYDATTGTTPRNSDYRFNEAVGYYRRNQAEFDGNPIVYATEASMRPSDITDGIWTACETVGMIGSNVLQ